MVESKELLINPRLAAGLAVVIKLHQYNREIRGTLRGWTSREV